MSSLQFWRAMLAVEQRTQTPLRHLLQGKGNSMGVFRRTREVPLWISLLFLVLMALFLLSERFAGPIFMRIEEKAQGLITLGFLNYVVLFVVIIGGLFLGIARLQPRELGLHLANLPAALIVTALLWTSLQLLALVLNLLAFGEVRLAPNWLQPGGVSAGVGQLLFGQLLGNAPFEEIAWRGFLLPQCYFKLQALQGQPQARVALAIVLSQGLFALSHIPVLLSTGVSSFSLLIELLVIMLVGIIPAGGYLRTGNLWPAMGLHALNDAPAVLFAATWLSNSLLGTLAAFLCAVLLLICGTAFTREDQAEPRRLQQG